MFRKFSFFILAYFIYASIFEFEVIPQTVEPDEDTDPSKFILLYDKKSDEIF